jgi:acetoin utilization deacetylase AcuC-like enzyme
VLSAVDAVFSREVQNAFCLVRPPGHHASAARGMGFCLFNNVAVAAKYAQRKYSAERVLIADWDVHHGNGTQDIFYEDGSVLFFSTHQSPWYPGTGARSEIGEGAGAGKTINCPLPAGSGAVEVVGAFREQLLPAARDFKPDLILLSAGFDSRIDDPLGQFLLTDSDFRELTSMMLDLAADHCDGRVVSVLEGGYNLEGLALATEAHVRTLRGDDGIS